MTEGTKMTMKVLEFVRSNTANIDQLDKQRCEHICNKLYTRMQTDWGYSEPTAEVVSNEVYEIFKAICKRTR